MINCVTCHTRREIENMVPSNALISITSHGEHPPNLTGWGAVLRVVFDDMAGLNEASGFKTEQADQIIAFLDRLPEGLSRVHVQCGGAISRSPGVLKFLCARYGLYFESARYPSYNQLVYCTLCERAGLTPECEGMDQLFFSDPNLTTATSEIRKASCKPT